MEGGAKLWGRVSETLRFSPFARHAPTGRLRPVTASRVTEGGPLTWCATSGGGELEREAGSDSAPHQVRDLGIRSTGA